MNTIEAIKKRRATKKFDPNFVISNDEAAELINLAMLSPTAFNIQHWRFVVVRDIELRKKIRAATWMQPQITDASLLVIVCADMKAWKKDPERYWRNAEPEARAGILEAINTYYDGNDELQRDEAIRSCGIAAQTLMLAATSLGFETGPIDLSDFNEVGKLINLPQDHVIALFVAIGRGLEAPWPRGGQLGLNEVMVTDRFA